MTATLATAAFDDVEPVDPRTGRIEGSMAEVEELPSEEELSSEQALSSEQEGPPVATNHFTAVPEEDLDRMEVHDHPPALISLHTWILVAALLGVDARQWSKRDQEALKSATTEYLQARAFNADRGDGLVDLAHVAVLAGDVKHAEENLREALDIDPTFTAAYVNLADLYRGQQRDEEAAAILRAGLDRAADRPAVEFALGLTLVRLGKHSEALAHLRRAYELRPETIRFGYVYSVALFDGCLLYTSDAADEGVEG